MRKPQLPLILRGCSYKAGMHRILLLPSWFIIIITTIDIITDMFVEIVQRQVPVHILCIGFHLHMSTESKIIHSQ